jgi:hypothetical protein
VKAPLTFSAGTAIMDAALSFTDACTLWRGLNGRGYVRPWAKFCAAERVILHHRPTSREEAAAIIEVLLSQGSQRSDGGDQHALYSLLAFLTGERETAAVVASLDEGFSRGLDNA